MDLKRAEELFRLWPNYSAEDIYRARDHFIQEYCPDEAEHPMAARKFMVETETATKLLNEACAKRYTSGKAIAEKDGSKEYVVFTKRTAWSADITEEEYEQFKMSAANAETVDEHLEVVRGHIVLEGYKDVAAVRMKHKLIAEELQRNEGLKRAKKRDRSFLLAGISLMATSAAMLWMSSLPAGIGIEFGFLIFGALAFCGFYNMVEGGSHLSVDFAIGISIVFSCYYVFFHLPCFTPDSAQAVYAPATWVSYALIVALLTSVGSNVSAESGNIQRAQKLAKVAFAFLAVAVVMYVALVLPAIDVSEAEASDTPQGNPTEQSVSTKQGNSRSQDESQMKQEPERGGVMPEGSVSWENASDYIGETVRLYGPVVDTYYASESKGQPTYLHIGSGNPSGNGVSVVIWEEDSPAFPSNFASYYSGKNVVVKGELYVYNDAMYVKVTNPGQVDVID